MKVIYEPKGAAKEYSDLAVNLFIGCEHGCLYCYAPDCMRKDRKEYHSKFTIRKDVINLLQKDLIEMSKNKDKRRVLMSFISDPYQGDWTENIVTQQAIELFRAYDIRFQVLTKGGMKAARDFFLYKKGDAFATTLTFFDNEKSLYYEPGAALPEDRIAALKYAKRYLIETWVSFEPVIDPEETFKLIDLTHKFTDLYKIGKITKFNTGIEVDWKQFTLDVIKKLETLDKKYFIKDSLKKYL
jgi:DNA repair photolyase